MKQRVDISKDRIRLEGAGAGLVRTAGVAAVVGLGASFGLGVLDSAAFLRAYVLNYTFVVSLALGALFFVIIQHLTRAGWSVVVRRLAEQISMALPVLAVLALPIVILMWLGLEGVHAVYPWTDQHLVGQDPILAAKRPYLNVGFFTLRLAGYLVLWVLMAGYFYRTSVRQDETGEVELTSRMQARSAPAIIVFGLTLTFFSFDLLMSLDPYWFSTIFGVYYFSGSAVGFFALLALVMIWLQQAGRISHVIQVDHYHDVGKLMFAFVVFWAYIAFSQYMLIWYGNIPEETTWYVVRQQGLWLAVSLVLLFGHFIVPFVALMSRHPKRRPQLLKWGAWWVLAMHWCDMFYLTMPHAEHLTGAPAGFGPLDAVQCVASLIGIGGAATWAVLRRMEQAALIPCRDPRLGESLEFENI